MSVTPMTWIVAIGGLILIGLLGGLQLVAFFRPRDRWTIENVYGGDPSETDPVAYFAFNRGFAVADPFTLAPLQIGGSIGMLAGERWGFLLALVASVPFWYTAISFYFWDRDLGFRQPTAAYWIVTWAIWPTFGVIEGVYCFVRLLG
jgi:hypothetical protein